MPVIGWLLWRICNAAPCPVANADKGISLGWKLFGFGVFLSFKEFQVFFEQTHFLRSKQGTKMPPWGTWLVLWCQTLIMTFRKLIGPQQKHCFSGGMKIFSSCRGHRWDENIIWCTGVFSLKPVYIMSSLAKLQSSDLNTERREQSFGGAESVHNRQSAQVGQRLIHRVDHRFVLLFVCVCV